MDPLEKRYQDQLEPQLQPNGDGGDLNAGQQPSTQSYWQEAGGIAADLNRTLERVQQQEAWLQSQSEPHWQQTPSAHLAAPGQTTANTSPATALFVVDTSRADWQQQVSELGMQGDVLLIQAEQHGLEQVRDALGRANYERVQLLVGERRDGGRGAPRGPAGGVGAAPADGSDKPAGAADAPKTPAVKRVRKAAAPVGEA